MNKAKITYRFDPVKKHVEEISKPSQSEKVIPLHPKKPESAAASVEEGGKHIAAREETANPPPVIYDTAQLNQFTTDFGAWSSPFDIETEKLEEIIRESDSKQSNNHHQKSKPEPHHAVISDEGQPVGEYDVPGSRTGPDISEITSARYEKRSRLPAWSKVFLSASSAVITGVLLGTLILNMFSGNLSDPSSPDTQLPVSGTDGSVQAGGGQNQQGTNPPAQNGNESGTPVISNISIPSEQYYFLQNGVFSTEESANAAQRLLKENGFGSVLDKSDGYRVYAAFSTNRDDALFLGHKIQQKNLETYIKEISRPSVTHIKWPEGNNEGLKSYITGGADIIHLINGWTSNLLAGGNSGLSSSQLQELKTIHQSWSEHATSISAAASDGQLSQLGKMNAFMNTAVESMTEYAKNPNETYLWQAQTAMMNYIFIERDFLTSVTP